MKTKATREIVVLADALAKSTARSRGAISREIFADRVRIDGLASGNKDVTTASHERALEWFSENWPDGAEWPADIERPQPVEAAE